MKRLTIDDLRAAFSTPRADHPGSRGVPHGDGFVPLLPPCRPHVNRLRRVRHRDRLAECARLNGSRVVTREHRRIVNAAIRRERRQAITRRREATANV